MQTLAITATKGGVGKTTLAVHLAVAAQQDGLRVLLLDLDQQGSSAQWAKDRARLVREHGQWFETAIDTRRVFANDLADVIRDAASEYDICIIDTPPHADFPVACAVDVADLVLMPTRPNYLDLHAAKAIITFLQSKQANAFGVINQLPHNSARIADDAAAFLTGKGMRMAPIHITLLQPYTRAFSNGMTAPELAPEGRHATEIGQLWAFVKDELAQASERTPVSVTPAEPVFVPDALDEDPFESLLNAMRGNAA